MLRILKISALVSVVILLNAVTTLLFVQNAVPAVAGPNCVNGDVNGDAAVDITDPIYLLSYMFEGGPEPIACAQTPSTFVFKLQGASGEVGNCSAPNTCPPIFLFKAFFGYLILEFITTKIKLPHSLRDFSTWLVFCCISFEELILFIFS